LTHQYYILIDIGATYTRVAIGNNEGRILYKVKKRTIRSSRGPALPEFIINIINKYFKSVLDKVSAISIGSIGPLDIKRGEIIGSPNIKAKQYTIKRAY